MSHSQDARHRRVGTAFSSAGQRTVMGYWAPLALTVGIAAIGVATWIWTERNEDDDDDRDQPRAAGDHQPPASGPSGVSFPRGEYEGDYTRETGTDIHGVPQDDASVMARMQGALRRTPSPQQIFDGASKRVAAGVAAAGAFVGGALTSIREEDKRGDFEDHSRWSEEVESRNQQRNQPDTTTPAATSVPSIRGVVGAPAASGDKRRKTVVIVVSSVSSHHGLEDLISDHVSILSHLPEHVNPDAAKIFVLIYAPGMKHAPNQASSSHSLSITSSYSNIAPEEATPSADLSTLEPRQLEESEGATPLFNTLYTQGQAIVDNETMIMPFSTPTGYVHLVRHLSPDTVYVQELLTGPDGSAVQHISGWVRQVVVVVGDEGGRGGLIDSDDDSTLADKGEAWWHKEGVTGIGKRIDVVDVLRVGDDWRRRISGHD
ncbi:hypothetical protein BJX99DRAFT_254637 [Aspergillus californicus]